MLGTGVIRMKEISSITFHKGEINMKKSLFVFALAIVLVFSFAAIAGAKYAGYATDGAAVNGTTPSKAPGYMSWGTAKAQMTARGFSGAVLATPHGGYATATAKCAVCHSVHRAKGVAGIASNVTAAPAAGMTLTYGTNTCVECHTEWGAVGSGTPVEWAQVSPGPHGSGCTGQCHQGGIHGSGGSKYHGMNVFMFGGVADSFIDDEIAAGNVDPGLNPVANSWFVAGTSGVNGVGGIPTGLAANIWAKNRQMATGFLCARTGCHTNSMFTIGYWGYATVRAQSSTVTTWTTGHKAAPGTNGNHAGANCGPCHAGNPAGGYLTATTPATARAYGCDQCHDMVGVLTNSTAFPHSNKNIEIYEWDPTRAARDIGSSRNLWMYAGNMGRSATGAAQYDPSFTVIEPALENYPAGGDIGQWKDGACLKCHVAIDAVSVNLATGSDTGAMVARQHGRATFANFPGYNATGASLATYLLYLFK